MYWDTYHFKEFIDIENTTLSNMDRIAVILRLFCTYTNDYIENLMNKSSTYFQNVMIFPNDIFVHTIQCNSNLVAPHHFSGIIVARL